MDDSHSCAIFKQQSCSAFVIWRVGTRQAMAGVAAQRIAIASIVKASALLTRIVYNFRIFNLILSANIAACSDQNHSSL